MENSLAIANYFVGKSLETGIEMTPMKLVKLTYISHGWHLGLKKQPLINEATEAWRYGPVVPSVYNKFKVYGSAQIKALETNISSKVIEIEDKTLSVFLDEVWNVYKGYNGLQLSTLTHQPNTPWDIVYNQRGGKDSDTNMIIPNELIQKHYEQKIVTPATT